MSSYYGAQPDVFRSGSPWPDADLEIVRQNTEIFPGFFILTTVSEKPGTRDMNELSLAIKTPEGLAVVVGCSHPGVDKVLENATSICHRRLSSRRNTRTRGAAGCRYAVLSENFIRSGFAP